MTSVCCQGLLKHKVYFRGSLGKTGVVSSSQVHHLETFNQVSSRWFLKAILDDLLKLITVMLCSTSLKRACVKNRKKRARISLII